jgi:hypothetical protein
MKETLGNGASWDFHQVKSNIKSIGFTYEWQNKHNSFFNMCKMVTFEVITPKIESSSTSDVL